MFQVLYIALKDTIATIVKKEKAANVQFERLLLKPYK